MRTLLLDVLEASEGGVFTMAVGDRIRQARKEAGLTQEQLSDLIGVGARMVQHYEAEDNDPYRSLPKIAEVTNKSLGWLLYGVDPVGEPAAVEVAERLAAMQVEIAGLHTMLAEVLAHQVASQALTRERPKTVRRGTR